MVVLDTPQSAISSFFKDSFRIIKEEIFLGLAKLGEECVVEVRDRPQERSWIDHTSNLRSSINYAVYEHGKKLIESALGAINGGQEGKKEGQKVANELAKEYTNTYALVVLAGMNYASFVEAIESKDVLASVELWARLKVDERVKKSVDKAMKRINLLKL